MTDMVVCSFPPPSAGSPLGDLSIEKYLLSSGVREYPVLKNIVDSLPDARLSLDPMPESSDQTISSYHARTAELLPNDRQEIHVAAKAEFSFAALFKKLEKLDALADDQAALKKTYETDIKAVKETHETDIKALKETHKTDIKAVKETHETDIKALKETHETDTVALNETIRRINDKLNRERRLKIALYGGNLLLKMLEVLLAKRREKNPGLSLDEKAKWKAYELLKVPDFEEKYGLDKKYHPALKSVSEWSSGRNKAAHETHCQFAILLSASRHSHPEEYDYWEGLFPFCFGETIEQLVESDEWAREVGASGSTGEVLREEGSRGEGSSGASLKWEELGRLRRDAQREGRGERDDDKEREVDEEGHEEGEG